MAYSTGSLGARSMAETAPLSSVSELIRDFSNALSTYLMYLTQSKAGLLVPSLSIHAAWQSELRIHILICEWMRGEQIRHHELGKSFTQETRHSTIPNPMEIAWCIKEEFPRSQTSYRQDKEKQEGDFSHRGNPLQHHKASDLRGLSLRQNNTKWSTVRWLQSPTDSY